MTHPASPTAKFNHHPKDLVLDHYHCTFFLPLIGLNEKDFQVDIDRFYYSQKDNPTLADEEAQAYLYFSPALRNILFDCNTNNSLQAVKEWRLSQETIKNWQLHLGKKTDLNDPVKYQRSNIVSVRLLQYFNGIYLLAFRVEPEALAILRKKNDIFDQPCNTVAELSRRDPQHAEQYHQLAMENWLHFTRHVRLLYPTFPQQNDENKIAPVHLIRGEDTVTAFAEKIERIQIHQKPGQDFSPVICELLKAFAKQPEKVKPILDNYSNFYDDRLFVSVAYGIAGEKLPDKSLQRINTLVSHIDRQEAEGFQDMQGYAYTPEVILQKGRDNAFSLWEGLGGYYSYTDFSNTYLSTGLGFRTYIATEHIPHIYDRMLIQALFYQASLRYYDNRICDKTSQLLTQQNVTGIREQRGEFVRFTNQYWFHNLTTQMQGKDIFNLQQQALGLQRHYTILKDELERTDEYIQTAYEINMSDLAGKFTQYGLSLAVVAIYYSLLPIINEFVKETYTDSLWLKASAWVTCLTGGKIVYEATGLLILLLLIPAIFVGIISKILKNKK